jgi:hypothetical protein
MDVEKRIVGAMEEGNAYRAFACALDRVAMEPDSMEAKACMALALYAREKPMSGRRMAAEVVEEDPGNELARLVLIMTGPPFLEDSIEWMERPEGFTLSSRWFRLLVKLGRQDEAEKYAFQMSQDESPVARADFLENVVPWYHEKAEAHERREMEKKAREKEKKESEEAKEPVEGKKGPARKKRGRKQEGT